MAATGNIGSRTGVVGIVGHPVSHSLSPRMHNAAFAAQGLDMVYLAFDVAPEALPDAVAGLRALDFRGVNVTIPHKTAVLDLLDSVEETAGRVGAVNTIVNDGGVLVGHNTDLSGFGAALRGLRPEGAMGLSCFVAGAGGAARAVVAALIAGGARSIRVCNRTVTRAEALCAAASTWGATECVVVSEEEAAAAAAASDLLVNATSVGLTSSVKDSAVPVDILSNHHIVVDLVYAPGLTMLVREARARGATAIDGKEMLVMQAAGSYQLWTGRPAPVDIMRDIIGSER